MHVSPAHICISVSLCYLAQGLWYLVDEFALSTHLRMNGLTPISPRIFLLLYFRQIPSIVQCVRQTFI